MSIELKTPDQIARMRSAGRVVAATLQAVAEAAKPGVTTRDLDELAAETIASHGAKSNFFGYSPASGRYPHDGVGPPFPGVICTSVNDETIHGIPGPRVLCEGDLLSVDCGAMIDGWHADAAITVGIGDVPTSHRELMRVTEEALAAGIAAMRSGRRVRDITQAISAYVGSQGDQYGIVREYTGHGIGSALHQDPNVPNIGGRRHTPRLVPGMVLAIEPMIVLGPPRVRELEDQWTVSTVDGSVAAHFEHTVAITDDGIEVLTVL
ncbi:MAG TPA: type I methionyl aminopeptidase [Aeromicrobium sp.]|nr:type I methionyl aminopeptidase [Aeromicrobium sp.]